MAYCSKPYNYRQKPLEEEILPRLFTPNKARRANDWLRRSGNYRYDEKVAAIKSLWNKEEERRTIDKVLKESFNPQMVPRVRVWLNDAGAEEKTAIMKLFRSIASQPTPEKITATHIKPGNTFVPSRYISTKKQLAAGTDVTKGQIKQRKKVNWEEGQPTVNTDNHGGRTTVAHLRTEFDIAPNWRAPKRVVVPMTQVTRQTLVQERLPRLTKHTCLYGQREFIIHPEWIIH